MEDSVEFTIVRLEAQANAFEKNNERLEKIMDGYDGRLRCVEQGQVRLDERLDTARWVQSGIALLLSTVGAFIGMKLK